MNQRGRYSGYRYGGYNFSRRKQPVGPVYENFEPKSEQKEENKAHILLVHLPAFLEQQIMVSIDESTSYIKVHGERALANNMRARFNTGYNVPKNCRLTDMKTLFGGGILTIRIPKIINAAQTDDSKEAALSSHKETIEETKPQKSEEGTPLLKQTLSSTIVDEQTEGKDANAPSPQKVVREMTSQKGQDGTPQKANLLSDTTKQTDEKVVARGGETVDQKAVEKMEKSEANVKPIQAEKLENVVESNSVSKEEGSREKSKESKIAESAALKSHEEKEKEKEKRTIESDIPKREEKSQKAAGDDKEKPDSKEDIAREEKEMENANAFASKCVAMEVNEDRQLMVNIFAAVSLIVAIGTHIFYSTIGNSG